MFAEVETAKRSVNEQNETFLQNHEKFKFETEIKMEFNGNSLKEKVIEKEKWTKDVEFLFSCVALSVGLGNVWRFPFTALENGGGAFLLPYLIILIFVGRPLYFMELLLGQFSSRSCVGVYDMSPAMRGIGVAQLISTCIVTTYYASLMGLTISYFFASMNDPLPWSQCKEEWNVSCIDSNLVRVDQNFSSLQKPQSSAELYFTKDILKEVASIHDGIGWPNMRLVACLIISWLCIGGVLIKGIKSSGKASYFLAVFPYIIMIILLVRATTLEGSWNGIKYFITPQWNKILEPQVWYAAVTQVFYSLAVCFGSIIMYASYNRFDRDIYKDVNIITTLDTSTSLLAGFIIFGILGHLAHVMDVGIDEVTKSNVALAFMAYPDCIAKLNFMPNFFSMLFFIMLFSLGIGSNIGMVGCIITVIRDRFPKIVCWKLVIAISMIGICIGSIYTTPGGQFLIIFLDFYGASFVAFFFAIIELLTVTWIYGLDRFCHDVEFMLGRRIGVYWRICWGIVTPLMMIGIFVYFILTWESLKYQDYEFHPKMLAFGWCISMFCLLQLPIWAIYAIINQKEKTFMRRFVAAFKPNSSWGPTQNEKNKEYQRFLLIRLTKSQTTQPSVLQKIYRNIFGKT